MTRMVEILENIVEEKILVGNPYLLSTGYLIAGFSTQF